ncbi:MAG: hypothetical protein M1274_04165 [Actinobacteria bacterium]|nr:hypothetical protein [Actinomycetota bacterium]
MDDTSFERLINIQAYTDAELKALAEQLSEKEREISKRRRMLHGEIDIVRAEMVRRLRDKHGSGQGIFKDGDISALTAILSGRGGAEADQPERGVAPGPGARLGAKPGEGAKYSQRPIQERFRDLSAKVVDERVLRYISKQAREGRHLDDIMSDDYVVAHTSEAKRAQLLENPDILKAIESEIEKQFADYKSITRPKADAPEAE